MITLKPFATLTTDENHDKIVVIVHDDVIECYPVKDLQSGDKCALCGRKYHEKRPRRVTYVERI